MASNFINFESLPSFKTATILADKIWELVAAWNWLAKSTIGSQWIRATDSIGANIAEGFGRYHKKDKQKFYYNARGSTIESIFWCQKSYARKLITQDTYNGIMLELQRLPKEINTQIRITEIKLKD